MGSFRGGSKKKKQSSDFRSPEVGISDNTICQIHLYPLDNAILIIWIVIYPVDSASQRLNNEGLINE